MKPPFKTTVKQADAEDLNHWFNGNDSQLVFRLCFIIKRRNVSLSGRDAVKCERLSALGDRRLLVVCQGSADPAWLRALPFRCTMLRKWGGLETPPLAAVHLLHQASLSPPTHLSFNHLFLQRQQHATAPPLRRRFLIQSELEFPTL